MHILNGQLEDGEEQLSEFDKKRIGLEFMYLISQIKLTLQMVQMINQIPSKKCPCAKVLTLNIKALNT